MIHPPIMSVHCVRLKSGRLAQRAGMNVVLHALASPRSAAL
jgi:hypothetical protein